MVYTNRAISAAMHASQGHLHNERANVIVSGIRDNAGTIGSPVEKLTYVTKLRRRSWFITIRRS